jgi:excisionase family DNA binding protein
LLSRSVWQRANVIAARTEWLTISQVCEELGVGRSTIDMWRRLGTGPTFVRLPNNSLRIRRADLEAWIDGLEAA